MSLLKKVLLLTFFLGGTGGGMIAAKPAQALEYEDYPIVKLRTLDKITARTMTFEAKVGTTMKFGEIYIKVQTCRKPPPVEKTEAAAFLQIWQTDALKNTSNWIFSGWMFASSPTLSAMDHPVYDVWVIDCLGKDPEELPPPETTAEGDGVITPGAAQPQQPPAEQLGTDTIGPATQTPAAPEDTGPVTREDDPGAFEDEPVPSSNMPADAVPAEETSPAPAPATPPVEAAPEPHQDDPSPEGIY